MGAGCPMREKSVTTTAKLKQTWQGYAQGMVQDAILAHKLTYRRLAELLDETHGMKVAPKTLARKIGRGSFDAGFFFTVMSALGVSRIDMAGAPKRAGKLVYTPAQDVKRQSWMPQ